MPQIRTSLNLSKEELKELQRQSKEVLGKINVNGYIRYLIQQNRKK